jgi:hypothetical protein
MVAAPLNKKLYEKARRETKARFSVYPSAVSSAWLVKRYKDLGGRYSTRTRGKSLSRSIKRWRGSAKHTPGRKGRKDSKNSKSSSNKFSKTKRR